MGVIGMSYNRAAEGSMYMYEAAQTITINTKDVYHAVIGASAGSHEIGFTFLASATGEITDTENNGGVLRCTNKLPTHGLTTGQFITLNGMGDALHNGVTGVTVIDQNTFDCDDIAYNSIDDTGSWQRGSSLTIDAGYGGTYTGGYSITGKVASANKNFKAEVYAGTTAFDEFATERLFGNTGFGVAASGGIGKLPAGSVLWVAVQNTTDTTNLVIEHMNLHLSK